MILKRTPAWFLSLAMMLILSLPTLIQAQSPPGDVGGKKKKGDEIKGTPGKLLEEADYQYSLGRYEAAKELYVEVLRRDPTNFHATFRTARCSYYIQAYEDAATYYESCVALDKDANDTMYFELGTVYRLLDRHNDAQEQFVEFRKRWPYKDDYAKRTKIEIKGCESVAQWKNEPQVYAVKCLDINTAAGDQFPSILKQNEEDNYLVITSHRNESKGNEGFKGYGEVSYSDLWISKIENDSTFSVPENLGKRINTELNDGSSTFSPDGQIMYYSICGRGKLGYGCSIYESHWDPRKKRWNKSILVEALRGLREVVIDSRGKTKKVPTYDVQPNLSADGNTMFFVSDRTGGIGKLDIWYSSKEGELWSEPRNLGNKINTPFNELSPFINTDNTTLYFSSDGHIGWGGYDLYSSEGQIGAWGDPTNLGAPLNSSYDDFGGLWFHSDSLCYFTTNRPGCAGRDDIYFGRKNPPPPISVAVHGVVIDMATGMPVPFATVFLYEIDEDGEYIPLDTFRTGQDARYNSPLELNKNYIVIANAPEYLVNEEKFNTFDIRREPGQGPLIDLEKNVNIKLERIWIGRPIILDDIYYSYDSSTLRTESKVVLDSIIDIVNRNPQIRIEIGSHTDSNGSEEYNKALSERRAQSAIVYLMQKGIAADRLEWYGYGESKLRINPELTDVDEQFNRRTEFKILSIDYEPPPIQ